MRIERFKIPAVWSLHSQNRKIRQRTTNNFQPRGGRDAVNHAGIFDLRGDLIAHGSLGKYEVANVWDFDTEISGFW